MTTLSLCSIPLPQSIRRHTRSSSDTTGIPHKGGLGGVPPPATTTAAANGAFASPASSSKGVKGIPMVSPRHHRHRPESLFQLVLTKFSSTPLQETEYSALEEQLFHQAVVDAQEQDPVQWRVENEYPHDAALTRTERTFLLSNRYNDANSIQTSVTAATVGTTGTTTGATPLFASSFALDAADVEATVASFSAGDETNAMLVPAVGSNQCILDDDDEDENEDEECKDEVKDDENPEEPTERGTVECIPETTGRTNDTLVPLEQQRQDDDAVSVESSTSDTDTPLVVLRKTVHLVRDSMVQQELFRVHETEDVAPSHVLQRMQHQNFILAHSSNSNSVSFLHNSILATAAATFNEQDDDEDDVLQLLSSPQPPTPALSPLSTALAATALATTASAATSLAATATATATATTPDSGPEQPTRSLSDPDVTIETPMEQNSEHPQPDHLAPAAVAAEAVTVQEEADQQQVENIELLSWNPFEDISSWLDGGQGIEVTGSSTSDEDHVHLPDDNNGTTQRPTTKSKTHRRVGSLTMVRSSITTCTTGTTATFSGSGGGPLPPSSSSASTAPFRILGTGADDVSCHPHVLSPPLMESLLAFVPEYTTGATVVATTTSSSSTSSTSSSSSQRDDLRENSIHALTPNLFAPLDTAGSVVPFPLDADDVTSHLHNTGTTTAIALPLPLPVPSSPSLNFWLKYSLVRDGASLPTFLRQVRTSTLCVLAIETDEGHVFGAFTSQPWRLSKGWYGSKDTFLWKMRRSRLETAGKSIVQQVCQESEIQVYPYRTGNAAVQYCSKECLMLGQGEIIPSPRLHNPEKPLQRLKPGSKHYGYALYLDKDLTSGTTSSSETFGNPCLIDPEERGARFYVSNIEVWTLTPHDTVAESEQSELSNLFLDGGRDNAHRLNFMNILVGGPI